MGRHPHIRPVVMGYLLKHTGKPVTAEDMIKATGLSLTQVQGQMRSMIAEGEPVKTITRAQIWVYAPEPEPEPETETETEDVNGEIFEGIGRTRSGAIIVRDGKGILYVAREMDV